MPPRSNKDEIQRSRKNCDKARNEMQKSVLLGERAIMAGDRLLDIIRQSDRLQVQSNELLERSGKTLGRERRSQRPPRGSSRSR